MKLYILILLINPDIRRNSASRVYVCKHKSLRDFSMTQCKAFKRNYRKQSPTCDLTFAFITLIRNVTNDASIIGIFKYFSIYDTFSIECNYYP